MNCWRKFDFEADYVRLDDEIEVVPPLGITTEQLNAWFNFDRDVSRVQEFTFEEGARDFISDIIVMKW